MGGALAVLFVERHPQAVRRFAFIGPPLGVDDWGPGVQQSIREGVNPFIPIDGPQFDRELALLFATPPEVPAPVRKALIEDPNPGSSESSGSSGEGGEGGGHGHHRSPRPGGGRPGGGRPGGGHGGPGGGRGGDRPRRDHRRER